MKYTDVTCGECGCQSCLVVVEWPPSFYWCRYCYSIFTFAYTRHTNESIWQLKGFEPS